MKKKILLIMMLFVTLSGSYKEEAKAANNLDVIAESLFSGRQLEAPRFTERLQDVVAQTGATITLTARVVGIPEPQLDVYHNNVPLQVSSRIQIGRNEAIISITITNVESADAGIYTIHAHNSVGATYSHGRVKIETPAPVEPE